MAVHKLRIARRGGVSPWAMACSFVQVKILYWGGGELIFVLISSTKFTNGAYMKSKTSFFS